MFDPGHILSIFTALIRRMIESTVFSLSVHTSTERGVPPSQVRMGVPYPADGEGGVGIPHPRSQQGQGAPFQVPGEDEGVPPSQVRTGGTPHPGPR